MLELPQRRQFATRDDFAAAFSLSFEELWGRYHAEAVGHARPEWADNSDAFSLALPISIARQGGDAHGVAMILKHAFEMKKIAIGRIARVERDGQWMVFFEVK